ncbi:MAG: PQQ-dependent sugar dehydrogenase [Dehalococcoidia bacterium]
MRASSSPSRTSPPTTTAACSPSALDGYLYVATGDGGNAATRAATARTRTALGKILRVDVDQGELYAIPADNLFAGGGGAPEWAYGLRNPGASASTERPATRSRTWAKGTVEEINLQPAGATGGVNYGWNVMEGSRCFRPASGCDQSGLVLPVMEYGHDIGCSVTGGYVYRGSAHPALLGAYIFGDYCSGRIWALAQQDGLALHGVARRTPRSASSVRTRTVSCT